MAKINEEKFSSVEIFENGICIHAKTGPDKVSKIYLRNEDVDTIVDMFADIDISLNEEDEYADDINDAIY